MLGGHHSSICKFDRDDDRFDAVWRAIKRIDERVQVGAVNLPKSAGRCIQFDERGQVGAVNLALMGKDVICG